MVSTENTCRRSRTHPSRLAVRAPSTGSGRTASQGNASQTAQLMVDLGADRVIAGGFSARSLAGLRQLQLTPYGGVTGQVGDVLALYRSGGLRPLNTAQGTRAPATGNRAQL